MAEKECTQKNTRDVIKTMTFILFLTLFMFYCMGNETKDDYDCRQLENSSVALKNKTVILDEKAFKNGFTVWDDNCRIPNVSAFDDSVKKFVKKEKSPKCSSLPPVTSVILDVKSWTYTLKINKFYQNKADLNISCCYSSIHRKYLKSKRSFNDDDRYTIESSCHPIKNSEIIPKTVEFMVVNCKIRSLKNPSKSTTRRNIHAMVIDKQLTRFSNLNGTSKPSVLIIAIDSLSRLNLIRSMPKTYEVLENNGFLSLEGYTKVADNTFPNVIPILSGMFVEQMIKTCWKSPKIEMDQCPFLWKNFKESGYVTTYVEDQSGMSTYNYNKYGFRNAPTDYYLRPFMVASEKLLPITKFNAMNFCVGSTPIAEHIYHYIEDFVSLHKDHGYFAVFWLNTFSHNDVNAPSSMDQKTAEMLTKLLTRNQLNNAVTFLLSDHGMRFGEILETYVGWLEERMPALYMRLPPGYTAKYPERRQNFLANKNRLTSPFDLHLTLKNFLSEDEPLKAIGCITCHSLLRPVSVNRTCELAGIESHWCTCDAYEELDNNSSVSMTISQHVVTELNARTIKYKMNIKKGFMCSKLKLHSLISIRHKVNRPSEYLVVLETLPGHGKFSVTVKKINDTHFGVPGDVSRINMYGSQSSCTTDWNLIKICYCVRINELKP